MGTISKFSISFDLTKNKGKSLSDKLIKYDEKMRPNSHGMCDRRLLREGREIERAREK